MISSPKPCLLQWNDKKTVLVIRKRKKHSAEIATRQGSVLHKSSYVHIASCIILPQVLDLAQDIQNIGHT